MSRNRNSIWRDQDANNIRSRIRSAQYQQEPSMEAFFGLPPTNPWRTYGVQEQQVPLSQIDDPFTQKAKLKSKLEKEKRLEELLGEKSFKKEFAK